MSKIWNTKHQDLLIAEEIMAQHQDAGQSSLALFELVVDLGEKKMSYQIAEWVQVLALKFKLLYGEEEGDQITRRIIGHCMRDNQVLH